MASELLDPSRPEAATSENPARTGIGQWLVDFFEARCERSRLIKSYHSWPVRAILLTYEFLASLSLAVILILAAAFTQAAATFVEAAFGTPAAQFGIYQSWWYMSLLGMLAVNIFCAAAIRYPWKRYQTGFVITHIGLLTLLGGTAISRWYGVDAQTQIFEGRTGQIAQEDSMQFMLFAEPGRASIDSASGMPTKKLAPMASFSFEPGPFNWNDYGDLFALLRASELEEVEQLPAEREALLKAEKEALDEMSVKIAKLEAAQPVDEKQLAALRKQEEELKDEYADKLAETPTPSWALMRSFPKRACRYISGAIFTNAKPSPVLYDRNGVRVEVLEYYSDSNLVPVPSVSFRVSMPSRKVQDDEGRMVDGPVVWTPPRRLGVRPPGDEQTTTFPYGVGEMTMAGGGKIFFWRTGNKEQTAAFIDGAPKLPIAPLGNVVLHARGKRFEFTINDLIDLGSVPLEGTDLRITLVGANATPGGERKTLNPYCIFEIHGRNDEAGKSGKMALLADAPYRNIHDYERGVYGEYWFDHGELTTQERMAGLAGTRMDIIQGDDLKLYRRNWNGKAVWEASELASKGSPDAAVTAFVMPIGSSKLYIDEHLASSSFDGSAEPVPFKISTPFGRKRPAAKLRVTVDDQKPEEFWISAHFGLDPERLPPSMYERRELAGKDRKVWLSMPLKAESIGFRIRLKDFERKLDPGTSQAAHFASTVDFLDLKRDRKIRGWKLDSGSRFEYDLPDLVNPTAIAMAAKHDMAYVFDDKTGAIYRFDLTTQKGEIFVSSLRLGSNYHISQLVLDAAGEYLYWCEPRAGEIGRVRLANKMDIQTRLVSGIRPVAIALNNKTRKLYWLDSRAEAIGRANFDGTEFEPKALTGIKQPAGIAVDEANDLIYWSDAQDGGIRSSQSDGKDRQLVLSAELNQATGELALDAKARKLYWFDPLTHTLFARSLDASGGKPETQTVATELNRPSALLFDAASNQLLWVEEAVLRRDVWITMNAPVEYSNPTSGRSYRLFQEQFAGPFRPGEPEFEENVSTGSRQDELFLSILTVNYDPGRGIWQVGCLLIIVGITVMFYMRAYFFMPGYRAEEQETPAAA